MSTEHSLDEMWKGLLSLVDGETMMKANECEYCSGNIQPKKVTVNHSYKGKLVIIKDVPVGVCQECGQRYYAAATLEKLDTMAQNSDTAPEKISVPVMVMSP